MTSFEGTVWRSIRRDVASSEEERKGLDEGKTSRNNQRFRFGIQKDIKSSHRHSPLHSSLNHNVFLFLYSFTQALTKMSSAVSTAPTTTALVPTAFVDFKLQSVHALTSNTSKFVFELPEHQTLGMTVASCVMAKFTDAEGKNIIRPYTPTSDADQKGSFEFIVKRYDGSSISRFCAQFCIGFCTQVLSTISQTQPSHVSLYLFIFI